MCGRVNVIDNPAWHRFFRDLDIDLGTHRPPRYNLAPGADLDAVFSAGHQMRSAPMRWGIVPAWSASKLLINARAETIAEKTSFRKLVQAQRVVVPITGFFEWRRSKQGKQPFHFTSDIGLLLIAGIYQITKNGEQELCLITTAANSVMAAVHHRMPVILNGGDVERWLTGSFENAQGLMRPYAGEMVRYKVSTIVNNAAINVPECVEPLAA